MDKFKRMNAFQLKLLMVIFMLLNHLHYIDNLMPIEVTSIFTILSRCVAPMFAYFAVEGILHTNNIKKYCLRLSILAGVIFIVNAILNQFFKTFSQSLPDNERAHLFISNNVIFTLALGVIIISLTMWGKKTTNMRSALYLTSIICFIIGFLWGEWGTVILPFMVIKYFFHNNKAIRYLGYGAIEVIAIFIPYSEPLYFLVFPFILLYNGERGPNTSFNKYFFYIFYPIHLWIIFIINFIVTIR